MGSSDFSLRAWRTTSGTMVSTTSSRRTAGPMRASTSERGARPGRNPSILALDVRRFRTLSYVASTVSAGTSIVMPTWLFGSFSVLTESGDAIKAIVSALSRQADLSDGARFYGQIGNVEHGDGVGCGGGLANTGPVPGSFGTM